MMQKGEYMADQRGTSLTPSKRQKYSNYTPRKRYIKQQQELNSYHNQSIKYSSHQSPPKPKEQNYHLPYTRNLSSSRKAYAEVRQVQQPRIYDTVQYLQNFSYNSGALDDCTSTLNCRSSLRKQKFKKGYEDREVVRKLNFEDQNKDVSNNQARGRYTKIVDDTPMTPRRVYKKQNEGEGYLSQKMAVLQTKITKLQKMTPKRSSTPKVSRVIQNYQSDSNYYQYAQRYQNKMQSISTSQVSTVSQRENQLMSRVSLGRLVEQQEGESEIEVIQDLSYKISSKLQSIIRNFG